MTTAKSAKEAMLIRDVCPQIAPTFTCRQPMYQRLSKSAPRDELNRKNVDQLDGLAIANGRLTMNHVPTVAQPIVIAASGSRLDRRCAINGTISRAG